MRAMSTLSRLEPKRMLFSTRFVHEHSDYASTSKPAQQLPKILGAGKNVFNRNKKLLQRNRAAENFHQFDFLRAEIAYRLADRIYDIKRFFPIAVDFGCGPGSIAPHIFKENVGAFIQMDMSDRMIGIAKKSDEVPTISLVADEEIAGSMFKPGSVDLAVSCLSVHWINDLPAFFQRVHDCLTPDGAFIAALFGGQTLFQLRCSLQLAEMERLGGLAAHISPYTEVSDIGSLMNRAGFKILTLDADEIEIKYANIYRLMYDLKGMAEQACSYKSAKYINRDALDAASAIYQTMYADDSGALRATFQIIYLIGWRQGQSTPKPAKRGSAEVSLKELGRIPNAPDA